MYIQKLFLSIFSFSNITREVICELSKNNDILKDKIGEYDIIFFYHLPLFLRNLFPPLSKLKKIQLCGCTYGITSVRGIDGKISWKNFSTVQLCF